jgi:hypothetical protein
MKIPTYQETLAACKGRKGLRSAKPKGNGFFAYVWRMVEFHSGLNTCLPMMSVFDLRQYCEQSGQNSPAYPVKGTESEMAQWHADMRQWEINVLKPIQDAAEAMVDPICKDLGYDPLSAARRWKGLLY